METSRQALLIGGRHLAGATASTLRDYSWKVSVTSCLDEANSLLREAPPDVGLLLLDPSAAEPDHEFERLFQLAPCTLWVALLSPSALENERALRFVTRYCHTYLPLPLRPERASHVLESTLAMARLLRRDARRASQAILYQDARLQPVGQSPAWQKVLGDIERIAPVDAPVLITGESGTGKELTARLIHERSRRHNGPFNAVNCGALPAGLIQSELFGHEKGAFTGADRRKIGIIESTSGGTLFLDEIGDLPLELQVNLLRFLEDHRFYRLGGSREIEVDVRVLAATHVDLEAAVKESRFREDFYHRLNVLQVKTPSLRERAEDIEELAGHFFRHFRQETSCQVRGFSHDSLVTMRQYAWPGNIRELINRVRRAMVMCDQRLITPAHLGLERRRDMARCRYSLHEIRDEAEREAVIAALARNKHQVLHAAEELGVSRATLYRLIDKHHIDRPLERLA